MELVNKKILHIESFPDTPLIDTSTEIALNLKDKNNVNFFWCGYDLPWKDWESVSYTHLTLPTKA